VPSFAILCGNNAKTLEHDVDTAFIIPIEEMEILDSVDPIKEVKWDW